MKNKLPIIAISIAVIIWGSTFIVTKTSMSSMTPAYLMFIRSLIGVTMLFPLAYKNFHKFSKKALIVTIITGLAVAGAYNVQNIALQYTTSAMNSFLENIYLVIVPFISWALTKSKPTVTSFISALLAIIGVILISFASGAFDDPGSTLGMILTLVDGVLFGINIAVTGALEKDKDPLVFTFIQLSIIMVVSFVVTVFFETRMEYNFDSLLGAVYLGIFATGIAWILRNYAQNHMSPITISIILPFTTVIAVIISLIIGETTMNPLFIVGTIILLLAVFLEGIIGQISKRINKISRKNI